MDKYYIISNKHRYGDVIIFWKSNFSGYTKFKESAGLYLLQEIKDKYDYPIYGTDEFYFHKEDNFIIAEKDLNLIAEQVHTYNYLI